MEYFPRNTPVQVRQFIEAVEVMHPEVNIVLEKGGDIAGDWWIDVQHQTGAFTVQWKPEAGFALHPATDDAVFGEMPYERYSDTATLLRRAEQLIDEGTVGAVGLRDFREVQGVSQAELAARLGIQQAAVSKVERRQDLHLDTLSAIVKALGGTLEMKVKFAGGEVPLKVG